MRTLFFRCALALAIVSIAGVAHASSIVYIDGAQGGCIQCNNPLSVPPGTVVNITGPKLQLTLGPGSYDITNAANTGYYSAWAFNGGGHGGNWVWSFQIADDATSTMLKDDYINLVTGTQAAMADLTGTTAYNGTTLLTGVTTTAGFFDVLTLNQTTTLDFFVDDYYTPDNYGGVALRITSESESSVPEPGTLWLMVSALGILGRRVKCGRLAT